VTFAWLTAFVWTLAFELPIYTLLLSRHVRERWDVVALALAVNAATHPTLWLALAHLPRGLRTLVIAELLVVAAEGTVIALVVRRPRAAFVAAALANAASFAGGALLWSLAVMAYRG